MGIVEQIISVAWPQLLLLAVIYILVLILIILDLWAGTRKAKRREEIIISFGLRKTSEKAARYYNLLLALTIIDVMQMITIYWFAKQTGGSYPLLPALTILGGAFLGFTEVMSIYEKAEDKERAKMAETARLAARILSEKNIQDMATKMAESMKCDAETNNTQNSRGPRLRPDDPDEYQK